MKKLTFISALMLIAVLVCTPVLGAATSSLANAVEFEFDGVNHKITEIRVNLANLPAVTGQATIHAYTLNADGTGIPTDIYFNQGAAFTHFVMDPSALNGKKLIIDVGGEGATAEQIEHRYVFAIIAKNTSDAVIGATPFDAANNTIIADNADYDEFMVYGGEILPTPPDGKDTVEDETEYVHIGFRYLVL